MAEEPDPDRLRALEDRIARLKAGEADRPNPKGDAINQGQLAWRMVIELVAGLLIGFGIGYGLDALLGSTPWLMLIFTILGFVAGIKTMIRSAKEVQAQQAGDDTPRDEGD
ncbi:F0F1 ATP synthase subunit I [Rhodobacterales bacterium HKCCE2091]|nr:F0F1 ATP synthase subunit I [Rhodobacterales bacterium HKCCE2091]